jgi:hypothetical protein
MDLGPFHLSVLADDVSVGSAAELALSGTGASAYTIAMRMWRLVNCVAFGLTVLTATSSPATAAPIR